jgi:hypothetical protein
LGKRSIKFIKIQENLWRSQTEMGSIMYSFWLNTDFLAECSSFYLLTLIQKRNIRKIICSLALKIANISWQALVFEKMGLKLSSNDSLLSHEMRTVLYFWWRKNYHKIQSCN